MRFSRWFLAFVLVAAAAGVLAAGTADADVPAPLPEDTYPDADCILTDAADGEVLLTFKVPSDRPEDPGYRWEHKLLPADSSYDLVRWTKLNGDLHVVCDGAVMRGLNLIIVDDASSTQKFVGIEFRMVSGHIGRLSLIDAYSSETGRLGKDYEDMFNPIMNADVHLDGGRVETFVPTDEMIRVDNMEVYIGEDMTVDRFLTSGENGRYGNLYVGLRGGTVGLMTNMKSRIGSLTYELDCGSVDYFSIGADTEMNGNLYLERACTSYVSGDVDVYVDPCVRVGSAIVGGGIMETPNMLWNGVVLGDAVVRNISVEAHDLTIVNDLCFLDEKRTKTLNFINYKCGGQPLIAELSDVSRLPDGTVMDVYGPDGIWDGYSTVTVNSGTSVFTDTNLVIPKGGSVSLEMGSKFVVTHHTVVYGTFDIMGEAVNNHLIEVRGEGKINGRVTGMGITADEITSQSQDSAIKVMTEYDSALINQSNVQTIREITALLQGGSTQVRITTQYEDVGFMSTSFLISLKGMNVSDSFVSGYRLLVNGIDGNTLTACNVDVTIPASVPFGKVPKVYLFVPEDRAYEEVPVIESSDGSITFRTDAVGDYSLMYADRYVPPSDGSGQTRDDTLEIVLLVAGIVLTLAAMVYTTVRFRK